MPPETRAIIAASAHALVTGETVAGLYDHAAGRHLRIAAEARGEHLQGYDGDRNLRFGGTLPELRAAGTSLAVHMEVGEGTARGYDRRSSGFFTVEISGRVVQLYDHAEGAWTSFTVQVA